MPANLTCAILAVASLAAISAAQNPAKTLYVSPTGNDAWSGALPEANPAKTDGPFATLERARDEVRKLKAAGPLAAHNLIDNAPHKAILFGGNDHLLEFNEIHSVDLNANDAGAIYAGYNPTMRGNVIRYNYFHHLYGYEKRGCNGVYLDDMFCSAETYGNIFYEVYRAVLLGGGRDNLVENNVFVNCKIAVHVDARALGWAAAGVENLKTRLAEMPYQEEPWRTRFPQLLTYLDDEPAVPKGNVIARNIVWRCERFDAIEEKARPHVTLLDNLVEEDPKFVDEANLNFRLREDSPAWKLGFKRIPIEDIGVHQDDLRASWQCSTP